MVIRKGGKRIQGLGQELVPDLGAVGSIVQPELQETDRFELLDKSFLARQPGSSDGIESSVPVVGPKRGGGICPQGPRDEIFLCIVVFRIAERREINLVYLRSVDIFDGVGRRDNDPVKLQ